jgi:hypothetical protein
MSSIDQWEEQLADAFEILLGRPLVEFDPKATYALYFWNEYMSEEFYGFYGDDALRSVVAPLSPIVCSMEWGRWSIDLGRSVFIFDDDDLAQFDFGPRAVAALRAVSRDAADLYLTGADLAQVMRGHNGLLDLRKVQLTVLARVHTDGTLFGAMRAATWTMGGPENLTTSRPDWFVVEPRWKAELARIPHPGLRTHLENLCDDEVGMSYVGAEYCPWPQHWLTGQPGHTFVTAWSAHVGVMSSAIFATSEGSDSPAAAPRLA